MTKKCKELVLFVVLLAMGIGINLIPKVSALATLGVILVIFFLFVKP